VETINKWMERAHAGGDRSVADRRHNRKEGEGVLLEHIPAHTNRILDLGCGDGRLLALALKERPKAQGVALDFSPAMLQRARERFSGSPNITVIEHNLDRLLPELGSFDAVVSSFAIHHCSHERKRSLYEEVFRILRPGGIFCNLEHVSSPTQRLHARFLTAIGESVETEDPSNKLLEVETQLAWLRSIGFEDVDCHWKWLELALLCGSKPA